MYMYNIVRLTTRYNLPAIDYCFGRSEFWNKNVGSTVLEIVIRRGVRWQTKLGQTFRDLFSPRAPLTKHTFERILLNI